MYWIEDVGTGYILKQGDENQGRSRLLLQCAAERREWLFCLGYTTLTTTVY